MNLNPFDLRGPEFLAFYVALMGLTGLAVWALRRARESGEAGRESSVARDVAQDPYQIAFLRGGRDEVVRVAVVSLLERGLLNADGEDLKTTDKDAAAKARRPLDKAILTKHVNEGPAQSLYSDEVVLGEAEVVGAPLKARKLLPDAGTNAARIAIGVAATIFLWAVAGTKISIALSRGRTNIVFLILLAVLAPLVVLAVSKRSRTAFGDKVSANLQGLFAGLQSRRGSLRLHHTTSELTFLAATFGVAALPGEVAGMVELLRLQPPKPASTDGGWWGSSCSTGSSCSGGSSCGGGGGCGGCGG